MQACPEASACKGAPRGHLCGRSQSQEGRALPSAASQGEVQTQQRCGRMGENV